MGRARFRAVNELGICTRVFVEPMPAARGDSAPRIADNEADLPCDTRRGESTIFFGVKALLPFEGAGASGV